MAGLSDANTNIKATTVAFSSLYTDISLAFKEHPVKKTIFSRNPILRSVKGLGEFEARARVVL